MPDLRSKFKSPRAKILLAGMGLVLWAFLSAYQEGAFRFHFRGTSAHIAIDRVIAAKSVPNRTLSLVIEPEDGDAPVVSMIDGAKKSVDLVMYSFSDKNVENALARAAARGVSVRVILNGGYQGAPPTKKNTDALEWLSSRGVSARFSPAYFAITHQKTLSVDGTRAMIMTFNLDTAYYKRDRDFGIIDADAKDVAAIETAFASDWQGADVPASDGDDLVWSPGSEGELIDVISGAEHSLLVYNEEMDDVRIEDALEDAARRGVNVQVLMTMDAGWLSAFSALSAAGVHVRTFDPKAATYIHAKVIVSDGSLAFLGSENFSDASLDDNRELGIVFSSASVIAPVVSVFGADWQKASPF